jgi:hypothetical protein
VTRADRILIVLVAALAIVSVPIVSVASAALAGTARTASVQAPGGRTVLDLAKDATYEIRGRRGLVCLEVSGGQVRATEADCPDHVCVRSGAARPGRPIVCAPNGVSVTISGAEEGGIDAISR